MRPTQKSTVQTPSKNQQVPRGASVQRTRFSHRFASYRNHHKTTAFASLQRLLETPLPTFMTVAVLAIAIALPAGLYVVLKNAQLLSRGWDGSAQISLYLNDTVSLQKGQTLVDALERRVDIKRTQYLSREDALNEFKELSGFGDMLRELDYNPLPAVIVVFPKAQAPDKAKALRDELAKQPMVESAQLDAEWVQRLYAMLALAQRLVLALGVGLGLAVLLIIINTVRLNIENRRDEIVIIKMVGATDAFVRRPFLYTGLWYGLGVAWWR